MGVLEMSEKVRYWHVYVVYSLVPDINELCQNHSSNDLLDQRLFDSHDFAVNRYIFCVFVSCISVVLATVVLDGVVSGPS